MNIVDDIELTVLAETGEAEFAEHAGLVLRYTLETLAELTGLPAEWWSA